MLCEPASSNRSLLVASTLPPFFLTPNFYYRPRACDATIVADSPDACLGRPQWFVLLALVALAQAGRPCTLRDLLTDPSLAMPAPAAGPLPVHQANGARGNSGGQSSHQHQQGAHLLYHQPQHHHQQNIQQTVHMQLPLQNAQHAHSSQQQQNPVRPRPIPDFFLDGGSPFYPATRTMPPSSRKSQQTSSERGGAEGSLGDWEDASQGLDDVGEDGLEHNQGDDYHLEITVYSHRVVGEGYSSHTEYTVLANASVPGFARRELEVARRLVREVDLSLQMYVGGWVDSALRFTTIYRAASQCINVASSKKTPVMSFCRVTTAHDTQA